MPADVGTKDPEDALEESSAPALRWAVARRSLVVAAHGPGVNVVAVLVSQT